jgi:hypothetical protein
MKEIATIPFFDSNSSSEAVAIVRHDKSHVALCLSIKSNGDIEVVLTKSDATKLLNALKKVIE